MSLLILVVDDDPAIRLSASYFLDRHGYSVITAENGKEALKMIEEYQPHLIVTEIVMPEMDGYELIRWVRQRPAFRLLPVVFLTGKTDTEDRIRGYQLGGDAYLPKPLELNELYAVIRNLLERSQLIPQLMQWQWRLRNQEQSFERLAVEAAAISQRPLNNWKQTVPTATIDRKPFDKKEQTVQAATIHQIFLTKREQAVLKFLTDGLSNSQIASCLYLSPRTIEKYVSNLLCKTGTSNRVELMRFAMEKHLIS
jgi:DNA-binding NarL/FixJ family response regulator